MVEITPLEAVTNLTITDPEPAPISEPAEPVAVGETAEPDEPRRRRRRSSAVATV